MKKLIHITLITLSIALPQQLLSFEKHIPILWIGSAALETLSLLSKDIRHIMYGNNPINESTKQTLHNMLTSIHLHVPADIKESRSLWPIMAGNIFSNHDSLFVSKNTLKQLQSGVPLDDQTKKDLIAAALTIKNNSDAKILAAFCAAPLIVWISINSLNRLLQKINASESEKNWLKTIASITTTINKSLRAKAFLASSIVGAFILFQRYAINTQVTALLT
jgi:hypothetical protein